VGAYAGRALPIRLVDVGLIPEIKTFSPKLTRYQLIIRVTDKARSVEQVTRKEKKQEGKRARRIHQAYRGRFPLSAKQTRCRPSVSGIEINTSILETEAHELHLSSSSKATPRLICWHRLKVFVFMMP